MTKPADSSISHRVWHTGSTDETANELHTDVTRGLSSENAAERLTRHGPNTLGKTKQRSTLTLLVHQFRSLIVGLLVAAGGVALALGEVVEAFAILIVIVINAVIGFVTEWKAARALEGLRKQAVNVARVLRDGEERQIPGEELVPGDVVLLSAGDRVPSDGRIVEQAQLKVDEAALTGESLHVTKSADAVEDQCFGDAATHGHEAPLGDRVSMVYLGTGVSDGRGNFIVTATGARTELVLRKSRASWDSTSTRKASRCVLFTPVS